jgi:N-acetylmuramoyl-L-alanine amidase
VGLQVGHWKIEEHPEEQQRLRRFSGAYYGGYDEWELNMTIAEEVRETLVAQGVSVDLLPATVPVGYQADAFVSIHVDGVTGAQAATRRGWKVATPFRASAASDALAAAIAESYPSVTGLRADPLGPSYAMRAYYAFAYYRYWHSIAPTTPATIVETAFMTHPADRELLFGQPELIAEGIAQGLLRYLRSYDRDDDTAREPVGLPMQRPATPGIALHDRASANSSIQRRLEPDEDLVPLARAGDWLLVFSQGGDWDLGWVRAAEVRPSGKPMQPPTPCCGE